MALGSCAFCFSMSVSKEAMAQNQIQPAEHRVAQHQQAVSNGNDNQLLPKSLYVGDLESNVTEAQIYDLFGRIGPVLTVHICRDATTNTSLGYGYVNYRLAENASEALRLLNSAPLNGNHIRVMYSPHDPSIHNFGSAKIFVKNLDRTVGEDAFYRTFAMCGPVLSSNIATDASGQSKGYGFVIYENEEGVQNAIKYLNGQFIDGERVYVAPFMRKEQRERENGNTKFIDVFVKNLSESMNDEDLRYYFSVYGPITSAKVINDAAGNSKCFGFVNFQNRDDAASCVENLNGKTIDGKEWYVGRALKKSELRRQYGLNLYLKYLDDSIDDNKLKELFSIYGTITSCKVMRDFHGYSKGSGFVAFSSPLQALEAKLEMNGKLVAGKILYVDFAKPKVERSETLQSHLFKSHNPIGMEPTITTTFSMYNRP